LGFYKKGERERGREVSSRVRERRLRDEAHRASGADQRAPVLDVRYLGTGRALDPAPDVLGDESEGQRIEEETE